MLDFFLGTTLESNEVSLVYKKYIAKLIKIKEHFELCNISRLKNSDIKKFTFRQKHAFDFIKRRLVYFVILNSLQKLITQVDFFATLLTDRSAGKQKSNPWSRFLEIQQLFVFRQKYVQKTKKLIQIFQSNLNLIPNAKLRRKLLRNKVRKSKLKSQRG